MNIPLINLFLHQQLMTDVFWVYTEFNMSLCMIDLETERQSIFGINRYEADSELMGEVLRQSGIVLSGEINVHSREAVLNVIIDAYG